MIIESLAFTLLTWALSPSPPVAYVVEARATRPEWGFCTSAEGDEFTCAVRYEEIASMKSWYPGDTTEALFAHPPLESGDIVFLRVFAWDGECLSP